MILGCSPPIEPRVARERMYTSGCVYHSLILIRSPRTAPRLKAEDGSTQRTPIFFPDCTSNPISASTIVLLPAPGGPVIPIIFAADELMDCSISSCPGSSFSINEILLASALTSPVLTLSSNSCHIDEWDVVRLQKYVEQVTE